MQKYKKYSEIDYIACLKNETCRTTTIKIIKMINFIISGGKRRLKETAVGFSDKKKGSGVKPLPSLITYELYYFDGLGFPYSL